MPKPPPPATPPRPDAVAGALLIIAALLIALPLGATAHRALTGPRASGPTPQTLFRINPNAAPAEQLRLLRGVGPALADRIVADRRAHGPFRNADDLRRVKGIGEQLPQRWAADLTFER
jgi:competence ComEA-like helix-hairpin-helix protein